MTYSNKKIYFVITMICIASKIQASQQEGDLRSDVITIVDSAQLCLTPRSKERCIESIIQRVQFDSDIKTKLHEMASFVKDTGSSDTYSAEQSTRLKGLAEYFMDPTHPEFALVMKKLGF